MLGSARDIDCQLESEDPLYLQGQSLAWVTRISVLRTYKYLKRFWIACLLGCKVPREIPGFPSRYGSGTLVAAVERQRL